METPTEPNNTFANWLLSFMIAVFTWLESTNPDNIYMWVFRGLTLFSLTLIIIINWKKAWLTLFPKKD